MPISADQWRAVTGVNNVRRPRQVGIKPRYMQQEPCGDEKLSHHPEPDANQDIARGGTGSKTVPLGKNGSSRGRKVQSGPMRDKVKDDSRSTWVDGDHDKFTSAMTSSVMGVQILVSVVVMLLLLLLSGDVETNPGPSLPFNPYDLMVECSEKIIHGLSGEPKTMATSLLAKGFIADGTLDDTFQLVHETKKDKGRRLYTAVLGVVRNFPQRYRDFISLLEQNRFLYGDLLKFLDTREKEMKVKMSHDLKSSAHSVSQARSLRQPSQHSASSESVSDTDQRINKIATHHGLAPSQLDVPCDQSHLLPISQLLVHWLSYCEYLGLTAQQKNHIRTDLSLTAAHQKPEEMLKRWQEKDHADSNKSHYRYLLRGCIEINDNAQLVGEICDVIAKNPIVHTPVSSGGKREREKDTSEVQTKKQKSQPADGQASGSEPMELRSHRGRTGKKQRQQSDTNGPQEKKQKIIPADGTSSGSVSNILFEDEARKLAAEFGKVVTSTLQSLENAEVKPCSLATHLLGLPVYQTVHTKECFLSNVGTELQKAKTLTDIFQILSRFWSFIDFELLKNVIEQFKLDDQQINTYLEKLKRFGETWIGKPTQLNDNHMTDYVRLGIDVDVKTPNWLKQYNVFKAKISEAFNLRVYSLRLFKVVKGCVKFVFLIPASLRTAVLPLSPQQMEQLSHIIPSVRRITIEDWDNQSFEVFTREGIPAPLEQASHQLGHCIYPPSYNYERQFSHKEIGGAGAQMSVGKMWPKVVLRVYFKNPQKLIITTGFNKSNVMTWAKIWEREKAIPTFTEEQDVNEADIRVEFVSGGRSGSQVGTDALKVPILQDGKFQPTMQLGLLRGNENFNKHNVIHEFGHALGLLHEHQRSCFWRVASNYLDKEKMKKELRMTDEGFKRDYEEKVEGIGSPEYDSDSVMHYWFRPQWIKDTLKKYRQLSEVENCPDLKKKPQDLEILRGIHKRKDHFSLAEKPSKTDYAFLAQQYGGIGTSNSPGSTRPKPSSSHSADQSQQSGPIPRESGSSEASDVEEVDGLRRKPQHGKDTQTQPTGTDLEHVIKQISDVAMEMNNDTAGLQAIAVSVKSSKLKMGVIGTTNSGKSTTLNALLKRNILPTSIKPQTARLVCIKHDSNSRGELFETKASEKNLTKIASGEEDICKTLRTLDTNQRSGNDEVTKLDVLELHAHVDFLSERSDIDFEIYDTPGTSEAGNSHIRQLAQQACEELAGVILVLAANDAYLDSSATLLEGLKAKYPLLMNRDEKRILVLVNKYDLMFDDDDDNPSLERERLVLSKKIGVSPEEIVLFSAKLGVEAVKFLRYPESVTENVFLTACCNKLVQLPKCEKCEENVKKVGEMLKSASKIEDVEKLLNSSCTNFREILKRKAVDECQSKVTELKVNAEMQMRHLRVLRVQLFDRFPEEVKTNFTIHLRKHVSTLIKEIKSCVKLDMLSEKKDRKDSIFELIDATQRSLIAVAKPKLSDFFTEALIDLQAMLSFRFGHRLDQLTKELEKVKDHNTTIEVGKLTKFPPLTIDETKIEGHRSIELATLHSHITSCIEQRQRPVYEESKVVDEDLGAGKSHSLVDENYIVTVYKANIDGLNDSFREFARYCGVFLREKIEAVLEEQTHEIACKAVAEVLKSSGQPGWERWLEHGAGHTKMFDEQIELWKNRKAKLDDAEQRLKEI